MQPIIARKLPTPSGAKIEFRTVLGDMRMVPGSYTHNRKAMSDIDKPLYLSENAFSLKRWPMYVTKLVAKDISIILAPKEHKNLAVER